MKIKYRKGYKYQLAETAWFQTAIVGEESKLFGRRDGNEWIYLDPHGLMTIKAGYAWDGPSGPTLDSKDFMRGSLAHDALYQLMREGLIDIGNREKADRLLYDLCREDGMSALRAGYVYAGVRWFAAPAATRRASEVIEAP